MVLYRVYHIIFSIFTLTYEIGKTIIFGTDVAGYPTLIASILFLGGLQLISLGIIGEYLGRVLLKRKAGRLILSEKSLAKR